MNVFTMLYPMLLIKGIIWWIDPRVFFDNGHNQLCHESAIYEEQTGLEARHLNSNVKRPYFKHVFVPTTIVTSIFFLLSVLWSPLVIRFCDLITLWQLLQSPGLWLWFKLRLFDNCTFQMPCVHSSAIVQSLEMLSRIVHCIMNFLARAFPEQWKMT